MSCFELPVSMCKRIQSALTRFWWDGPENKRKMSWVAWNKLTKSKTEGGLGLRDIQLFNQALLAKIAWRVITVPDCLLARILKGKYCHNQSFLEVELPSVCSHGWRGIIHGRNLLRENLGQAIGNGTSTRVWKDSWISLDEHIKPFGPIQEEAVDLRVSDLLTDDLKWNAQRIKRFLPEFAERIQCIKPRRSGAEDRFIWQPLPSGIYSTRSGYNSMINSSQRCNVSRPIVEFDWIKDIWSTSCSPKMRMFLWSMVQEALSLGENLQRRGINVDVKCPRCKSDESAIHTFFLCPFAKKVWSKIPLKEAVHIAATENLKSVMIRFRSMVCLPPSGVPNAILPWVCWSIWKDRNSLIFEGECAQPEDIATRGIALAREWNEAQFSDIKVQSTLTTVQNNKSGGLPQPNHRVSICMTDASWDAARSRAGLAWILKGPLSQDVRRDAMVQNFVNSPLVAEALAVREGLYTAANQGISNLWIGSDNLTLIGAIINKTHRKELLGIIKDIHNLSSVFVSVDFFHVHRENNEEADALAKTILRNSIM